MSIDSVRTSLSISVRRHFVDNFFFSHKNLFTKNKLVLDIGGKKTNKRGLFDIGQSSANVKYVNIDRTSDPDIVSDASNIPLPDNSFDIVIMGELLEHVPEPKSVLNEAYRLLHSGGIALITVPFLYPVHADPYDFGRYTDYFWQESLKKIGFKNLKVERQGTIFAVMALIVQHLFRAKKRSWRPIQTLLVSFLMWLDKKTTNPLLRAWTTGYGIVVYK
ncbi:MAG: class I SAM-dependent methyltransferase [Minisyncoccia bacterium]